MCCCDKKCICHLIKIQKINNGIKSEIDKLLLLNNLLTCENLNIVKVKLQNILDNLKTETNKISNEIDDSIPNPRSAYR